MIGNFMGTVQYNGQSFGSPTVAKLCQIMNDDKAGSPLQRYAKVNSLFFQPTKTVLLLSRKT